MSPSPLPSPRFAGRGIFITGTDTGVGKTVVTGLLARCLREEGRSVITQKWIETGARGFSKDVSTHLRIMGKKRRDIKEYLPHVCPYTFKFASSPHLAARLGRKKINAGRIKRSFRLLQKAHDFVIVEGTGGALVPYNNRRLMIDIAKELRLPVLIVAENRLGAINHALLTIEAVEHRGMKVLGVVFNNWRRAANKQIIDTNISYISLYHIVLSLTNLHLRCGSREGRKKG